MLGPRPRRCGKQHGYRNAQVTVLAPTGTIAFLMDCDTTGVEPDIALVKYKLLAGGGMLKIVNRTVPEGCAASVTAEPNRSHHRAHREIRHHRGRRRERPDRSQRPEAGASPGVSTAPSSVPRPAQHPLPGAPEDDGRRPAVHQRRHLQDRQHAQRLHRRADIATPTSRPGRWASNAWPFTATARNAPSRSTPRRPTKPATKPQAATSPPLDARRLRGIKELEAEVARLQEAGKPLRRRLPETRSAITHKFDIAGHEGYLTVGLFENGQPGELFITMAKEGSTIGG
jgi:ribonucleoside-diphosphate reductase alpha chain